LSHFDLTFTLHSTQDEIRLSLEPNHDVLPAGAKVQYLGLDGKVSREEPIERMDHKVFKGDTWIRDGKNGWKNVGWARIMIRQDGVNPLFEGAFSVMHDHHHVQMRSSYMQTRDSSDPYIEDIGEDYMVIFRDSDFGAPRNSRLELRDVEQMGCVSDNLGFNTDPTHPVFNSILKRDTQFWGSMSMSSLLGRRQIDGTPSGGNSAGVNLTTTIGSTTGCPTTRKVALVGVATDCTYTAAFNSTEAARANVITQFNSASNVYEKTFNISLGLHTLTVSDATCPSSPSSSAPWNIGCSSNATITDRLNEFSAWRGNQVNDGNAYWTLLSTCNTGSDVGLAWLGQLCVNTSSTSGTGSSAETVSGANVVVRTGTEWQVIAHETGHTFGAVHDCIASTCTDGTAAAQQCCPLSASTCNANGAYIMNPSTGDGITAFSACTVGNICTALGRNSVKSTCLTDNSEVSTITGNQCGNGIVEEGEECDCGGTSGCGSDSCCDPTTCKYTAGSVCDDSNDDCCRSCQYASSGLVCRASTGVCDPQEVCTGNSSTCPTDVQAPNGKSCGSGLSCASGQCTSRDLQCQTLMGSFTTDNDTYACDSSDCTLSCASPEFGANVCYGMQQNFLDGTACGGGGTCSNGQCEGSSILKEAGSWIQSVSFVFCGFFLDSIYTCLKVKQKLTRTLSFCYRTRNSLLLLLQFSASSCFSPSRRASGAAALLRAVVNASAKKHTARTSGPFHRRLASQVAQLVLTAVGGPRTDRPTRDLVEATKSRTYPHTGSVVMRTTMSGSRRMVRGLQMHPARVAGRPVSRWAIQVAMAIHRRGVHRPVRCDMHDFRTTHHSSL
jgi:hypothetical protein